MSLENIKSFEFEGLYDVDLLLKKHTKGITDKIVEMRESDNKTIKELKRLFDLDYEIYSCVFFLVTEKSKKRLATPFLVINNKATQSEIKLRLAKLFYNYFIKFKNKLVFYKEEATLFEDDELPYFKPIKCCGFYMQATYLLERQINIEDIREIRKRTPDFKLEFNLKGNKRILPPFQKNLFGKY